jgi:hypothetical protein
MILTLNFTRVKIIKVIYNEGAKGLFFHKHLMLEMLIQQQMSTHYTSVAQREPPSPKPQYATTHFRFQENGGAFDHVLLTYIESVRKTL